MNPSSQHKNRPKREIFRGQMISLALVVFDVLAINLAYLFALWFRFDCRASMIPEHYLDAMDVLAEESIRACGYPLRQV